MSTTALQFISNCQPHCSKPDRGALTHLRHAATPKICAYTPPGASPSPSPGPFPSACNPACHQTEPLLGPARQELATTQLVRSE